MKFFYVLDFSIFKVDGPTINEIEFIRSLESQKELNVSYFTVESNRKFISEANAKNSVFLKDYSGRFILTLCRSFFIFFKFLFFYKKNNPDIIVTRLGPVPFVQYLISLFFPKKLYVKTASRFWSVHREKNTLDQCVQNFIDKINISIFHRCLGIDTVTEKFKKIFVDKYGVESKKIIVIENAVNTSLFSRTIASKIDLVKNSFPVLGYVGNNPSKRGAQHLIQVYERLKKNYPNICVLVLGFDEEIISLMDYVSHNQLEKVFFLNVVPYENIPKIVNSLDIGYSFTTQHDLKEVGNSSQKIRQYISCGKPVITMKGTNQFVLENELGSLVDQNNIDEIIMETEKWIQRVQTEGEALGDRLHNYACEYLSTEKIFVQRLEFWSFLLDT